MYDHRQENKNLLLNKSEGVRINVCIARNTVSSVYPVIRLHIKKCILTANEMDKNVNPLVKYKHGLCYLC